MDKLLAIIRREYVETVRTKAFAVSTALVPVLMSLCIFLPGMLARKTSQQATRLGVVDRTGRILDILDKELASDPNEDFLADGKRRYPVIDALKSGKVAPGMLEQIDKPWEIVNQLDVDALVVIREDVLGPDPNSQIDYYSTNVGDFVPIDHVRQALNAVIPSVRLEGTGLQQERIQQATRRVDVQPIKISKEGKSDKSDFGQEYFTAIFFTLGLYITTLMAGMALSRGLLEEKANRVVEVLVSSVTPLQLMTGKILGHALVIVTQLSIWGLLGAAMYLRGVGGEDAAKVMAAMNPTLLGVLVVYFLLGYFLYASFFAAVGAICTTEMEAQQTQTPLVLMQVIPMVMAIAIVRRPAGTLAITLSMIPVFAPSVMMMRMAVMPPPLAQILASISILAVTIVGSFWAVSKVFRVGILMTGKKMTIPEVFRWLRAS